MKRILKDYFSFSGKEKRGITVLICLIITVFLLPYWYDHKLKAVPSDAETLKLLEHLQHPIISDTERNAVKDKLEVTIVEQYMHPFKFDPNLLDSLGWNRLGIPGKTIHTIQNYLHKKGRFYKPEDIRKIWGLKKEEADRLIPYVEIRDPGEIQSKGSNTNKKHFLTSSREAKPLDINLATAEQLMQIPGIGNGLPYRIINFRNHKGGFYKLEEILKTYGMTDSVFLFIKPFLVLDPNTIPKTNINTASEYEMIRNPYISKEVAKAIVIYRNQHGNFKSLEEVKNIVFINNDLFEQMLPYLSIN